MTKKYVPVGKRGIGFVVLAVALVGLVACGSGNGSGDGAAAPEAGNAASSGNEVVMRLIAYKPDALTVNAGTSVTWKQQDAGFHTVTSGTVSKDASGSVKTDPDGTFDSGRLAKGKDFSFTFDEPGTYEYFCQIHPATMAGSITAE